MIYRSISIAAVLLLSAASLTAQIGLGGSSNAHRLNGIPIDTLSGVCTNSQVLTYSSTSKTFSCATAPGAGGGEANTASSLGGTTLYSAKVGVDLRFKGLAAGSSKLTVTANGSGNTVDLDVVPANFGLTLANITTSGSTPLILNTASDDGVGKLQVNGNATLAGRLYVNGTNTGSNPTGKSVFLSLQTSYGRLQAYDYGAGASLPLVIQDTGGNVLVGSTTDNATDKMQVNGSLIATALKRSGTTNGCATFVSTAITSTGSPCGSGGSGVALQSNGVTQATAPTINILPGTGVTLAVGGDSSVLTLTPTRDANIVVSDVLQSGSQLLCSAGSTTTLTCSMTPTLAALTNRMLVNLCVTGAITGATTLTIDGLQVTGVSPSVKTFAGSNPASGDLGTGCRIVTYQSSDNTFRLPAGASAGGVTTTNAAYPMPVGGCNNSGSGTYFAWGLGGAVTGDCRGPNSVQPVLAYSNTVSGYAAYSFRIPQDWNGGTFSFLFREAQGFGGSGNLKWDVSLVCVAVNAADFSSLTFNTASTTGSVVNNTIYKSYERTLTAIDVTGCSAGQPAILKLARDTSVSGNLADSGQTVWAMFPELRYTRQ